MGKPIKVLFASAINPAREIESLYPPLGPAYLSAYLKKYLGKRKVSFELISGDFAAAIRKDKPDILGITCVSQNYQRAKDVAKVAKKMGVPHVLIGGSHISLYPLSLDKNIDVGIIGEGEETFLELIKVFFKKKSFETKDLSLIKGLAYWDKGKIKLSSHRPLIEPLDKIPMPDRTLFKVDPNKAYIFSSRGCPYRCIFCASSMMWNKVRFHSSQYVFREIKSLVNKYAVKRIDFCDDLFIADKKRLKKLVFLLEKEGLNKKVQFHVAGRANLIDDEICILLKKMNVKGLSLGLESGSPEILRYLKGDSVTVDDNLKAINTITKHGLYCMASFIIGSPIDTKKTILETLEFIKKSKLDEVTVYTLTPFPGTPIWDYAVKNKILPGNPEEIDWQKLDIEYQYSHDQNVHLAKNLNREDLYNLYLLFKKEERKRLVLKAAKMVFSNPCRLIYHLRLKLQRKIKRQK